MTVIDVHTHMLTLEWIDMLRRNGGDRYEVKKTKAGQDFDIPRQRSIHDVDARYVGL